MISPSFDKENCNKTKIWRRWELYQCSVAIPFGLGQVSALKQKEVQDDDWKKMYKSTRSKFAEFTNHILIWVMKSQNIKGHMVWVKINRKHYLKI